jgi:AraC-like DNA-binding protein
MTLAAGTIGSDRNVESEIAPVGPNAIVWRARDLISRHACDRNFGPNQLAARSGVSLRQLQTVFHKQGSSIAETIWEMRLEHARSFLSEDRCRDRTITEVAFEPGFNDFAHFSRRFKKRFGLSPRDFRRATEPKR